MKTIYLDEILHSLLSVVEKAESKQLLESLIQELQSEQPHEEYG